MMGKDTKFFLLVTALMIAPTILIVRGWPSGDENLCSDVPRSSEQYAFNQSLIEEGTKYEYGQGVPQDYGRAVTAYREAAEIGMPDGQTSLGLMYASGHGVPQDYHQAITWYCKAAVQGSATAENNLGILAENGLGISKDDAQAAMWYRKAAEQGEPTGEYNLGRMYESGKGLSQDSAQALTWYRNAAEKGLPSAQFDAGRLLTAETGQPTDYVEGLKWLLLSKAHGAKNADHLLESRKESATPVQLAQAEKSASEWTPEGAGSARSSAPTSTESVGSSYSGNHNDSSREMDEDNAKIDAITKDIQENGRAELRQLDPSVVRDTVQTFVIGERLGVLTPAQIARMGGIGGATQGSLSAQSRAAGGN